MQNQQGAICSRSRSVPRLWREPIPPEQTARQMKEAKRRYDGSVDTLARSRASASAPARIRAGERRYFGLIDRIAALVAAEAPRRLCEGARARASELPGGAQARAEGGARPRGHRLRGRRRAIRARCPRSASLVAILFLARGVHDRVPATRSGRGGAATTRPRPMRSPGSATAASSSPTWSGSSATSATNETMAVGIFDLDGFKAYNDTFGHPAGDALLARLGGRLAAAMRRARRGLPHRRRRVRGHDGGSGRRERAGGSESRTQRARRGLRDQMLARLGAASIAGIDPGAGSARRRPAPLRQQALRRGGRREPRRGTRSCRCSPSRTRASSRTSGTSPTSPSAVAITMDLTPARSISRGSRRELHDVGKAAIPAVDPGQAGSARRRRASVRGAAQRDRRAHRRRGPGARGDRPDRPGGPRAARRHRLSRRPTPRGDPDQRTHHRRRGRVRRHDERPAVPQGDAQRQLRSPSSGSMRERSSTPRSSRPSRSCST